MVLKLALSTQGRVSLGDRVFINLLNPLSAFSKSSLVDPVWKILLFDLIEEVLERHDKLTHCTGIIARWISAKVSQERDKIHTLSPKFLRMARKLIFMSASRKTDVMMKTTDKLVGLGPFWKNGWWWTHGRLGKGLFKILGVSELTILLPTSRLAEILMLEAHKEDHKGSTITLWRSRTQAWIWRGSTLAKRICKLCTYCIAHAAIL